LRDREVVEDPRERVQLGADIRVGDARRERPYGGGEPLGGEGSFYQPDDW
jgi:hypothetical protein